MKNAKKVELGKNRKMTKAEFLELAGQKWEEIQKEKAGSASFYDYGKGFTELWTEFGREAIEGSIGEKSKDRRKKKVLKSLWKDRNIKEA